MRGLVWNGTGRQNAGDGRGARWVMVGWLKLGPPDRQNMTPKNVSKVEKVDIYLERFRRVS